MQNFLTKEQEQQLVEQYLSGISLNELRKKYGFKTNKSITDKVKKYYGKEKAQELISSMRGIRKGYSYTMDKIENLFDTYFLGLLLTDGYVTSREKDLGLDLTDSEDFIDWCKFVLENKLYMTNIDKRRSKVGLWRIETAEYYNIIKLLALVYDKPFGMERKYNSIRKMFNDYNSTPQMEDCIV